MAPPSGSHETTATVVPLLISAGLFLTTALASQYLQHHLQQQPQTEKRYKKTRKNSKDEIKRDSSDLSSSDDSSFDRHQKNHQLRLQRQRIRRHREQQQQQLSSSARSYHFKKEEEDGGDNDDDDDDDDDDDRGYQEDEEPTDINNSEALELDQFRDYYKLRRIGDRLSFENLGPLQPSETHDMHHHLPQQQRISWDPCGFQEQPQPSLAATMTMPLPAPSKLPLTASPGRAGKKAHHRPSRRRHPSVLDREDENDFLPKNSNWNHFERYNEDDLERGIVASIPADHQKEGAYHHHQHHYQPFSNGNEFMQDESDRSADLVESTRELAAAAAVGEGGGESSSDTSVEPQFVWTDAIHVKKRSQLMSDIIAKHRGDAQQPIEGEPPARNRPQRLMTADSTLTLPTDNSKHKNSTAMPSPVEAEKERQFLRYSSTQSRSERVPFPPQRFPPPNGVRDHLERAASAETFATANSEISGMSASSHHKYTKQSNYNYQSRNHNQHQKNNTTLNVSSSHRSARAKYNAKIMPNKVVLIRHGQSMGNINEDLYSTTPDNAMPLTKLGWEQARKAGKHLKEKVLAQKQSIHFIVSPYARTVETFHGIVSAWCDPDGPEFAAIPNRELRLKAWYGKLLEMGLTWHEDPRIREQDFGNYQVPELIRKAKRDRHRFGVFYYRFPHGESASDVFDRVSTFLDSLWRSFDMNRSRNYVLVTHGISVRVLLARYFRYTIHQFNMLANPRNCEMVVLGHDGHGRLALQGRCQLLLKEKAEVDPEKEKTKDEEKAIDTDNANGDKKEAPDSQNENAGGAPQNQKKKEKILEVDEYKFFKRLRILPQAAIRKVDIRISYNDGLVNDAESG